MTSFDSRHSRSRWRRRWKDTGLQFAAVLLLVGLPAIFGRQPTASGQQASPRQLGPPVRDRGREFAVRPRHWMGIRRQHIVMQNTDYSCGAAALATVVRYYWGDPVDEAYFLRAILTTLNTAQLQDRIDNGLSMTDLRDVAVRRGYAASMGRQELSRLSELKVPVIVRIKTQGHEHFVVLRGLAGDRVFLADPIRGHVRLAIDEFARQWPDRVLLVVAKPGSDLHPDSPLLVQPSEMFPVRPELQVIYRDLTRPRTSWPGPRGP
jgi:predicted double-glycine peptidase